VYATWEPKIGKALLDEFRATVAEADKVKKPEPAKKAVKSKKTK
jgi:hypothetical protein